jgi:2-methylisocitrate lyase-like PEP mutase family enzyme
MTSYDSFLALHRPGTPLLIPNPWDRGTARVLAGLGFQALATTSGGFAASTGVQDGGITLEQALEHAQSIASAVDIPVSADFENGFAHDPADVAKNVRLAADTGLSGCSIEDFGGKERPSIYDADLAVERVAAAVEAAHGLDFPFLLTGRAENHIRGNPDLDDTIARLQAYAAAGADVLFAPGLATVEEIRAVCAAVERPVNVLARPDFRRDELFAAGVQRISVGGRLTWVAAGALVAAAEAIRDDGDFSALAVRLPLRDWLA